MDRRRSLLKIAALRSEREQQVGVNCTKGYLESTDAGLLFDGPRSMECFFNLRQSDGTQRPAQFSTSMLAIAVTPMDAIMFHCGNKSLQVSRATIGDDIHAVISYDGATAMCYINGIEVGAMQPTAYTPSALFRIGDPLHITKSPLVFCRHYNYAISAEEVAALYNDGDPAGYVLPNAMKELTPVEIVGENSYTWTGEDDSTYAKTINLSQKLSEGRFYRFTITVSNYESGAPFFVANRGINTYIPAQNGTHIIDVIIDRSYDSLMYIYGGKAGTDRRLTLIVNSIEPLGCIAEYLPQNLVGQWHEKPFEITGITTYTWTGETDPVYYRELLLGRFIQTGAVVMIKGSVSDYQSGEPFVYVGNRQAMIPAQNGSFTLKVINNRDNINRIYYYGGVHLSDRRLTIAIDSVELIPDVALSWLDSAKQFPLNDEYLPPLLQSDGGYDLAANGMPQIIIK